MSSKDREGRHAGVSSSDRWSRVRAYLRRLIFSWVAEDPEPEYSALDRRDGLGNPDAERQATAAGREPIPASASHRSASAGSTRAAGDEVVGDEPVDDCDRAQDAGHRSIVGSGSRA